MVVVAAVEDGEVKEDDDEILGPERKVKRRRKDQEIYCGTF